MTPDDLIIARVPIIGTPRVIYKAWRRCPHPAREWPYALPYHTITHFNNQAYGRLGTERFECPPVPPVYRDAGRAQDWHLQQLVQHRARVTRAAHQEILKAIPALNHAAITYDDNGTIYVEETGASHD